MFGEDIKGEILEKMRCERKSNKDFSVKDCMKKFSMDPKRVFPWNMSHFSRRFSKERSTVKEKEGRFAHVGVARRSFLSERPIISIVQ